MVNVVFLILLYNVHDNYLTVFLRIIVVIGSVFNVHCLKEK